MKNILGALLVILISTNSVVASDDLPELKIQQLNDSVYLHTSFQVIDGFGLVDSNGLVVLVGKDAYIVDTPWSAEDTEKLLDWIAARGFTAKGSVSTHFHADRTAGIEFLNLKSIPTYASALTNQILKASAKPQAANEFDSDDYWLVEDQIDIFFPGGGHSRDNVVVWLPHQQILFGGCLIRPQETESLGNTSDAVISEWSTSVANVQAKFGRAKIVVPGHGKIGDVSLLEHTRKLTASAVTSDRSSQLNSKTSED
jgi:glyoxylase-like metal-dependent hydrolase (beta-lactamase superfamily II)